MAVKVNTTFEGGTSLRLSYAGDVHNPVSYKVGADGTVSVDEQHVALFLAAVEGSSPASEKAERAAALPPPTAPGPDLAAGTPAVSPPGR